MVYGTFLTVYGQILCFYIFQQICEWIISGFKLLFFEDFFFSEERVVYSQSFQLITSYDTAIMVKW